MPRGRVRVLILGAGVAGCQAAGAMRDHPESGYEPLGFVDDDPGKIGSDIAGLPVLGTSGDIARLVSEHDVDEILIAMPSESGDTVRRLVGACQDIGVAFKIVPGVREIILGEVHIEQIRHVEPDDLLGRESVAFDARAGAEYLSGRRVLVTGAGGSIGGELCRQVAAAGAAHVLLLGRGENSIHAIESELRRSGASLALDPIIADVRDRRQIDHAFAEHRPDVVFHAAAHKHVYYMERFPEEAVLRNIVGTRNVLGSASAAGCERFVFISTDKAAEPHSVMGATKRVAEDIVRTSQNAMRVMAVRFGNVLGSRGSVVPLFKRQIAAGGPVTVSHPEVTRYFMTVREAAFLVIRAGAMGAGGELFTLDMGQPIRILDLARELITLSGYRPDTDVAITFIGLGPGEKLHERLWSDSESTVATAHPQILEVTAQAPPDAATLAPRVDTLERAASDCDRRQVLELLAEALPGYEPSALSPDGARPLESPHDT